jgi:hypothetical protein
MSAFYLKSLKDKQKPPRHGLKERTMLAPLWLVLIEETLNNKKHQDFITSQDLEDGDH